MKTETKHTPGPWKYITNVGPTKALIVEHDGTTVFETFNRTNDSKFGQNINFMVEACNNYERVLDDNAERGRMIDALIVQRDELAAALTSIIEWTGDDNGKPQRKGFTIVDSNGWFDRRFLMIRNAARAALEKLEGSK